MAHKNPLGRAVSVLAVDPGGTTGLAVVSIDKAWLRGLGAPTWDGMGAAIKTRAAYQVGRDPKSFDVDRERATRLDMDALNERLLPILASQPLVRDEGTRRFDRFQAILDGRFPARGADLLINDAQELAQVRQIAGLLDNYPEAAVVIESFQLRSEVRASDLLSPDRLRFAITSNEVLHGEGRIPFLQQPSLAKTTAKDDRLKRAGLYFPGMPHATDAGRHIATFLRRARQDESIRAAAWPRHFASFEEADAEEFIDSLPVITLED